MSKRIGIAVIVLYLIFAFILWEFNPQQWGATNRMFYCLYCGVSAFMIFWIPKNMER